MKKLILILPVLGLFTGCQNLSPCDNARLAASIATSALNFALASKDATPESIARWRVAEAEANRNVELVCQLTAPK